MEFLFPMSAQHRIALAPLVPSEDALTVLWMETLSGLSDILREFRISQAAQFLDLLVQAKEAFLAAAHWRKEGTALLSCPQGTRALLQEDCEPRALCRGGWAATAQPGTLNPGLDCTESQVAKWKDKKIKRGNRWVYLTWLFTWMKTGWVFNFVFFYPLIWIPPKRHL